MSGYGPNYDRRPSEDASAVRRWAMETHCPAVRRAGDDVILKLEVMVKHGGVVLDLPVEPVSDLLPLRGWLGHVGVMSC